MDDLAIGAGLRAARFGRGWRQVDVATRAGVSAFTISRLERGRLDVATIGTLRRVAAALDVSIDLGARWRGGGLSRLLDARHAAMQELAVRVVQAAGGWTVVPEVSFSIFGERGAVDLLGWHGPTRTLLVVELKTEIADLQDLVGKLDRKRRLAPRIAAERGWRPERVGVWLVVAESRTNRRRVVQHAAVLRAALPDDGRAIRGWLAKPDRPFAGRSFLTNEHDARVRSDLAAPRRVGARVRPRSGQGSRSADRVRDSGTS